MWLTAGWKRPAQDVAGSRPALTIAPLLIYNVWAKRRNQESFSVGKICSHHADSHGEITLESPLKSLFPLESSPHGVIGNRALRSVRCVMPRFR